MCHVMYSKRSILRINFIIHTKLQNVFSLNDGGKIMFTKNFILLVTREGIRNTDSMVRQLVNRGEIIFFTLPYTPPYNKFEGIKKLQVAIRPRAFTSNSNRHIPVSINVKEWIGHENEEYFEYFFMFLSDCKEIQQVIFTVGDTNKEKLVDLLDLANKYFQKGGVYQEQLLVDEQVTIDYISKKVDCTPEVAKILAKIFIKNHIEYAQMTKILQEVQQAYTGTKISHCIMIKEAELKKTKLALMYYEDLMHYLLEYRINKSEETRR